MVYTSSPTLPSCLIWCQKTKSTKHEKVIARNYLKLGHCQIHSLINFYSPFLILHFIATIRSRQRHPYTWIVKQIPSQNWCSCSISLARIVNKPRSPTYLLLTVMILSASMIASNQINDAWVLMNMPNWKPNWKPSSQANHKPQAPHACHKSHGDQHKSHGSQRNPTRDPTKDPTKNPTGPRDPTNTQDVIGTDLRSAVI
jgi:hypothetical protein